MLVTSSSQNSIAAEIAGTKCTKIGSVTISGIKKFTCIKKGSKLIWNAGSLLSYPEGSGNPHPPTYPETAASKYIQKLIDTTDLSKSTNKTKIDFIIEPSTSNNGPYVKIAEDGANTALKFYSALGMNVELTNLPIILGRSQQWSKKVIAEYLPSQNFGDQILQGGFTLGGKLIYTNLVNGTIHSENPPDNSDLSHVIELSDWAADIAHEAFHVYQASAPTKLYETFPIWMSEGSAQLFGYMTAVKLSKGKITFNQEIEKYLDWQHDTQKNCSGPIEEMQPPCNYTQGLFVVEYFVSKYGISGLEKLLHKSSGENFENQFLNATGDTLNKFYLLANQSLKARGWRNNVQANPVGAAKQQDNSQMPTPMASDLTIPTNVKLNQNVNTVTITWDPAPTGKIAIEFYRIHGDCIQDNVPCGSFEKDLWPSTSDGVLNPSYQIPKSRLSGISEVRAWKFEVYSGNNAYGIWAPSGKPAVISITQLIASNKLPTPTNFRISEEASILTFKWDPAPKENDPVDFYRIYGECWELNKSCGYIEQDIWPVDTGGEPPSIYQLKKSELTKISSNKTWKFTIYAGNNYYQSISNPSRTIQITTT